MRLKRFYDSVSSVFGFVGMVATGILLVATIFLTLFDLPWVAFLSGVLCAAIIGLVSRLTYAETRLSEVREKVRYIDDELPLMILYVDAGSVVRFHNQSFRIWLRARREAINSRPLRDVVGLTTLALLKPGVDSALAGRETVETLHLEGTGRTERMLTQCLPAYGTQGGVAGAYIVLTNISASDVRPEAPVQPPMTPAAEPSPPVRRPAVEPAAPATAPEGERRIFVDTMAEEMGRGVSAVERLRLALERDEFCLYAQAIVSLASPRKALFREVLLRLKEEEEGLMPPGAFLPIAEEYGLMPELDRWVVRHVLDWAMAGVERQAGAFAINLSAATIADPSFPDYVREQVQRCGARATLLCFEINEADVLARPADARRTVETLAAFGCGTTLCGFGQNADSFGLLKSLPVAFLKIDGDIVLGLTRNTVDAAKLRAITRAARATNRRTIAVFVENDATIAMLREHHVDYAQGFGIGRPVPMDEAH